MKKKLPLLLQNQTIDSQVFENIADHSRFTDVEFNSCIFVGDMRKVRFTDCHFRTCEFIGGRLTDVTFTGVEGTMVTLSEINLTATIFPFDVEALDSKTERVLATQARSLGNTHRVDSLQTDVDSIFEDVSDDTITDILDAFSDIRES